MLSVSPMRKQCIAEARKLFATGDVDAAWHAKERDTLAWLLAQVAEPKHLLKLEEWHAKDKSKAVKKNLKEGIDPIKLSDRKS